ncbi:MAG: Dam family site-specific DNA-(adenine-N6)-methyltransferase [Leptolyngbyaceae cyanobacterium]
MAIVVPPIKCQGIKTKLIPAIQALVGTDLTGTWIEPFCGSGVVAFNVLPERAILADTNQHIIRFYQAIQTGCITPAIAAAYLETASEKLAAGGDRYYYEVRDRFNQTQQPLDFLFLNRSCFNGIIRFNRKGHFNVPFCRKPQRFAKPYITKIVNQVRRVQEILDTHAWTFQVADFTATLAASKKADLVYVDPPYLGRHVDYYNTWTDENEQTLIRLLKQLPCPFILSTWKENQFRANGALQEHWQQPGLHIISVQHFYHIGASEQLRHSMTEALVTNKAPVA